MNHNSIIALMIMLFNIIIIGMEDQLEKKTYINQPILKFITLKYNKDIKQIISEFILGGKQWWYLNTTFPHSKAVTAVCFDNTNTLLATGSKDNKAYIFDITIKKQTHSFIHQACVNAVNFNSRGTKLATGSNDYTTRIFTIDNQSDEPFSIHHKCKIKSVYFNHTGKLLAIGEKSFNAHIFNIETQQIRPYGLKYNVQSITFDPTGTLFAITTRGNMRIIDITTNKNIILNNFNKKANFCCFDTTGKRLAIASPLFQAKIFDIITKNEITCIDHKCSISEVFFDGTGNYLITHATDNVIRIFNIRTHQKVASFSPANTILAMCVGLSKNLIAIGTNVDNNAYIFALHTNPTLEQILLKKTFNTWLLIEKPPKNITSMEKLLADISLKFQLSENELNNILLSFPIRMQNALWRSMNHKIQQYGKKIKRSDKKVENCTIS